MSPVIPFLRFAALVALLWLPVARDAAAQSQAPVFVLNSLDANVSVIDPSTWREVRRIATGKEPHHLYMTPDEKSIMVANALSDSLTFIDPKTAEVQRVIRGIVDPYQLRFSPDAQRHGVEDRARRNFAALLARLAQAGLGQAPFSTYETAQAQLGQALSLVGSGR